MKPLNKELYLALKESFNANELREVCLFINIDFENLSGDTVDDKTRELILFCQRHARLEKLIETLQGERPHINWYELADIEIKPVAQNLASPPDIDSILDFAKKIAKDGGRKARQYFEDKENIPFEPEKIKNFTTQADKEANEVIVGAIKKEFLTGHHIISEEGGNIGDQPKEEGYTWVIDAIDGTINFFHQLPIFCTAVGVLWNRKPVAGVIYNPISRELFFARKGGGAFVTGILNGRPVNIQLQTNQETQIRDAVVMTHLSSRRYARERLTTSGLLDALSNASRNIRAFGSGQISLSYVAQAKFHAFVNNATHSWDQVAGLVLVEEAGGIVTNFHGEPWSIDSESIIASANQKLHDQLTAIISAIYPFEGPMYRLGELFRKNPEMESKLIELLNSLEK